MKNFLKGNFLCAISILVALIFFPIQNVSAERINQVHAMIHSENIPPIVRDRMEFSVKTIGEQLFEGMELPVTREWKSMQEKTIATVFDKVLSGYSVDNVQIDFDTMTVIHVHLIPWENRINRVEFKLQLENLDPKIATLVKKDLEGVDELFYDSLNDLPIAVTDWISGTIKRQLESFEQARIPEYRLEFNIEPGDITRVELYAIPRAPIVRTVDLETESRSLPVFIRDEQNRFLKTGMESLIAVPVNFVIRHRKDLETQFENYARSEKKFRSFRLKTEVSIRRAEGEKIIAKAKTESSRFDIDLEAWADFGRTNYSKDDLTLRFDLGRKLSSADKIFIMTDLRPVNMRWKFAAGYGRDLRNDFHTSIRYNFNDEQFIAGASFDFLKSWRFRYEYRFEDSTGEAGILYKFKDRVGLEYVIESDENWIRLMGFF